MTYHKSVLLDEVIHYLDPKPGGVYVDVTFGGGGHTRALLEKEPKCHVVAFDWDMVAIEHNGYPLQEEFPGRLTLIWANFSQIDKQLKKAGFDSVDGILADFGTSQYQINERAGFSFSKDTLLDMRMSPPHQKITAAELLNKGSEEKLTEIFRQLGEEPKAKFLARLIVQERVKNRIETTRQLAKIVEKAIGFGNKRIHPATRIFQALRIYINKELDNIKSFLPAALRVLKPGGKLACISFHSLEDRIVKQFFKTCEMQHKDDIIMIASEVVMASEQEVAQNASSRSAKLRVLALKNVN